MHVVTSKNAHTHTQSHTHRYTHVHTHTCTHMLCTCIHTLTHTYTPSHTHTHYTHMPHAPNVFKPPPAGVMITSTVILMVRRQVFCLYSRPFPSQKSLLAESRMDLKHQLPDYLQIPHTPSDPGLEYDLFCQIPLLS